MDRFRRTRARLLTSNHHLLRTSLPPILLLLHPRLRTPLWRLDYQAFSLFRLRSDRMHDSRSDLLTNDFSFRLRFVLRFPALLSAHSRRFSSRSPSTSPSLCLIVFRDFRRCLTRLALGLST